MSNSSEQSKVYAEPGVTQVSFGNETWDIGEDGEVCGLSLSHPDLDEIIDTLNLTPGEQSAAVEDQDDAEPDSDEIASVFEEPQED